MKTLGDTQTFHLTGEVLRGIGESVVRAVPDADRVWVFGSAARGDNGPDSDVDVFFTYRGAQSTRESIKRNVAARGGLRWLVRLVPSHNLDVASCSTEVFDAGGSESYDGTLIRAVREDGMVAYKTVPVPRLD